jgi:hypothetical protein
MKAKIAFAFLGLQVLFCLLVFRSGLSGGSILAPADIPPALFTHYDFVDPASSGVPLNHHIIDQIIYDAPLQATIYKALRSGEIPWWDPYTFGGRPFLADAHISGTDPVRLLLYPILPFVAAYNWTRIVHFNLSGLGMLLLLLHFKFRPWLSLALALTYEFAGCFAVQFGHPWIHASFVYYPALWLVWDRGFYGNLWAGVTLSGLLVAAILYAGNLQSHSYLALMGVSFVMGYSTLSLQKSLRALLIAGCSGLLGCLLATPVVANQLEAYLTGVHLGSAQFNSFGYLGGIMSLAGAFPWALGTFRTLDLNKIALQQFPFGFSIFIGTVGALLALIGMSSKSEDLPSNARRRMAIWIVGFYFLIASTPLVKIFYLRIAPIAVIALIVLAGLGASALVNSSGVWRLSGRAILLACLVIAVFTNGFAFVVYPRIKEKVWAFVEKRANEPFAEAKALRRFQVDNLPTEISFRNPEVIAGVLGMVCLACFLLKPELRAKPGFWILLFCLNLLPLILFTRRFVPCHPVQLWQKLSQGSEQKALALVAHAGGGRIWEPDMPGRKLMIPFAFGHLYETPTVAGYAALQPEALMLAGPQVQEDIRHRWAVQVAPTNEIKLLKRFNWDGNAPRQFSFSQPRLNTIIVKFEPGPAGFLTWTDTAYPGWKARLDGSFVPLEKQNRVFSRIKIESGSRELRLEYRPAYLSTGLFLGLLGLGGTSCAFAAAMRERKRQDVSL